MRKARLFLTAFRRVSKQRTTESGSARRTKMLKAKPGDLIFYDYRPSPAPSLNDNKNQNKPIKLIQWNVERGYQLNEIIQHLLERDADILCLQELDIDCERSGFQDTCQEIARALGMKAVFAVEFEELPDPQLRSFGNRSKAGHKNLHGNAILTRFDFVHTGVIAHRYQPLNWEKDGHTMGEPRLGRRYTLRAAVDVGANQAILCYSAHLGTN